MEAGNVSGAALLVKIRTTQVEPAAGTAQLAAVFFELGGAVGTEAGGCKWPELQGFGQIVARITGRGARLIHDGKATTGMPHMQ